MAVFISEFIDSMFPIAAKARGAMFDALVSNADVNDCDLEAITVPTLVIHTKDDPSSTTTRRRATGPIPRARLVSLESGGHLFVGQAEKVRNELAGFLAHRVAA